MTAPADETLPMLGDVLATIAVIDVVCAPAGLDVPVAEPVIHDPASPPTIERGALVLAVGVRSDSTDAAELVARAAAGGAAAVVVKGALAPVELRDVAQQSGVALLTLPAEMTWSQAHSLIRTALHSVVGTESDAGGVPLGDLFALANAVSAMLGGAVTIEDRQSRVLAYSSREDEIDEPRRQTILGRRVPDEWLKRLEEAGVFRRLWAGEVVRYEAGPGFDLQPRWAIAVRAGDTILGSIWVAEGDRPFGAQAEDALRESARMAALHMIRHRSAPDLERGVRGELLRSILERSGSVDAIAYRLGVKPEGSFAVLAFEPQAADEVEGALERERVLDLVALYGEAFRHRSAAVQIGRTLYVLMPGADPERPLRLSEVATDIVARARDSLGTSLRGGIGSVVMHLAEVPRSRREADQVLRALASDPDAPDVSEFHAARVRVALVELRDVLCDRPHVRSGRVGALARHDAEHETTYIETLRAYIEMFGDIPRAAARANVHPNTFRYRLRRLVELSGLNIHDPDERLLVSLELRLLQNEEL